MANPGSLISGTSFTNWCDFTGLNSFGRTTRPIAYGGKFWAVINNGTADVSSKLAMMVSTDEINWTEADAGNGPDPYMHASAGTETPCSMLYPGSGSIVFCIIAQLGQFGGLAIVSFDMAALSGAGQWAAQPPFTGSVVSDTLGSSGGTGYNPGDTFYIIGIGHPATGHVTGTGAGGVVTSYVLDTTGARYTVAPNYSTSATSGIGTGLLITITAVASGGPFESFGHAFAVQLPGGNLAVAYLSFTASVGTYVNIVVYTVGSGVWGVPTTFSLVPLVSPYNLMLSSLTVNTSGDVVWTFWYFDPPTSMSYGVWNSGIVVDTTTIMSPGPTDTGVSALAMTADAILIPMLFGSTIQVLRGTPSSNPVWSIITVYTAIGGETVSLPTIAQGDQAGGVMVQWASLLGGVNTIQQSLTTDGGLTWGSSTLFGSLDIVGWPAATIQNFLGTLYAGRITPSVMYNAGFGSFNGEEFYYPGEPGSYCYVRGNIMLA